MSRNKSMRTGWIAAASGAADKFCGIAALSVAALSVSAGWPVDARAGGNAGSIGNAATHIVENPAVSSRSAAADIGVDTAFARELLAVHNGERDRLGIVPLRWSARLEGQALVWAETLAGQDRMEHARQRHGAGENLWMGPAGYYSAHDMVGSFIAEKRLFRPGVFPANSASGRWADVGHYTQLIWPGTQELGCALARNERNDFLVCRYWPAGNTIGVRVP